MATSPDVLPYVKHIVYYSVKTIQMAGMRLINIRFIRWTKKLNELKKNIELNSTLDLFENWRPILTKLYICHGSSNVLSDELDH